METEIRKVPAIEFRHVSLCFDEKKVLSDINLTLERGEMIFITGESGSGKSVLLRLAIALLQPDAGQVFIDGRDVGPLSEDELLKLRGDRMGIVFQEDSLFTGMAVYENVAYRLVEHGVDEAEIGRQVTEILKFVGLYQQAQKLPFELSGGMRRRLEIARALVGWPAIMLFDEPASGLDPLTSAQVLDLIIRARDIHGISSIYVTKKLDEIPYLATHRAGNSGGRIVIDEVTPDHQPRTRVMVLSHGEIIFNGSVEEFENSDQLEVRRLTKADNGTIFSDFVTADPWDRHRQPRERIL
ncbi:MAG TPA: ATP-binding cassette domain-containing protein [Pyrinomonadaceae bacterium]|jgi:ABC-type transporter Mla maintaining outer membrane lipid asymmetry ATPase subunit MlaF|nr:ATP-binding cassette domain-containing protein [Pyrinomonadaceae bacterium]